MTYPLRFFRAALAGALVGCAALASAQSAPVPEAPEVVIRDAAGKATVRTMRLPSPIILDGKLEEAIYRDVKPFGDFVQQEPHEGAPATDRTEAWVFFDDKNLYVSARLWETDSSKRVMSDMRRDSTNLYNNDHVAILFDTFNDHRNGFGFSANGQGGMFDWQTTNEQPSANWNGLWDVRTADFDGGWTIEFRIPFRSLRYQEGGVVWGFNIRRMVRWKNEISTLSPVPVSWGRRALNKVSNAGPLVGLEVPSRLRNIDVKPYLLGSDVTNRRASPPVSNDGTAEWGVDAKWGITQSVVTDFTYNTDFAQVEDDEAQVNLTRFSVLFPEKRDFFLEGQDVFNFAGAGSNQGSSQIPTAIPQAGPGGASGGPNVTPVVFFSRRIGLQNGVEVPILGGARMLGRAGAYQIGALQMHTKEDSAAGAQATDYSVFRLNRDVLSRSRIGMIATRRGPGAGGGYENYAYGVDSTFNLRTELQVNAYWAGTSGAPVTSGDAKALDVDASTRQSYRGQFTWNADKTGVQLDHMFVGEHFNPEVGFLRRTAFRRTYGQGRYSPRPKGVPGVRKVYYEGSLDFYQDPAGTLESREALAAFRMETISSDQWSVEYSRQYESLDTPFTVTPGVVVPTGAYEFNQVKGMFTLSPQRPVSGTITLTHGGFYGGTLNEVTWRGRVELGSQFQVEPTFSINTFHTPRGDGDSNLIGSRFTYTMTPRMFVSALVQYQSSSDSVTTNARFRWEYQPGSELFVVYNDGRSTLNHGFPELDNRSFVVKLTKLFRF